MDFKPSPQLENSNSKWWRAHHDHVNQEVFRVHFIRLQQTWFQSTAVASPVVSSVLINIFLSLSLSLSLSLFLSLPILKWVISKKNTEPTL